MSEYLMAIDWGSTKLTMIMARQAKEGINIGAVQSIPYSDIEGNDWRDIDFLASLLCESVTEFIDKASDGPVKTILGIPGYYTGILNHNYKMDIDGDVIGEDHIFDILDRCSRYPLPKEWKVLDAIPRNYIVDGVNQVDNPIDMKGSSLEVDSYLVCVNQMFLSQIKDRLAQLGVYVDLVRPTLLSSGNVFLTEDERQTGGILIDVGGSSTDIVVYKDGVPVFTEWFPVGGSSITNDLAIGLDIPYEQAEQLKGRCVLGTHLSGHNEDEQLHNIPLDHIRQIVELRIEEIFELIEKSIQDSNKIDVNNYSVVIIGGGLAPIRGAREFASSLLDCNVRIDTTTVASAYALVKEQESTLPPDGLEENQLNIKDRIKQWLLPFFNK